MATVLGSATSTLRQVKELKALTGLRGVAAIYVVVRHYLPNLAFTNPFNTFIAHGYLAVDLFFVLSGFVMALNYRHMFEKGWSRAAHLKFLGRRIARIYPLYFVGTIVGFLLALLPWSEHEHGTPLGFSLALNLVMIQAWGLVESLDGPGWSISAEWAAYLLFPFLLAPTMFRRMPFAWISLVVSVGILGGLCVLPASLVHGQHQPGSLLDFWSPRLGLSVLRCLPEFVLGILAFRLSTSPFGQKLASSQWIAPVLCLTTLILCLIPRTDLAVVLLFPLIVVCMSTGSHLPGRILASPTAGLLGRMSYSIYLTHNLLYDLMHWVHVRASASGIAHAQTYAAAVGMLVTLPLAFAAYRFIELPGRSWLRSAFDGPHKLAATAAAKPA